MIEEVDEVKRMHLVGQSQNTFREWNQQWTDISTKSFAELESQIFEVEELNERIRFLKQRGDRPSRSDHGRDGTPSGRDSRRLERITRK